MQDQNRSLTAPGPSQEQIVEYQQAMERQLQVVEIQTDAGPVRLTPSIVRRYIAIGQVENISDSEITLFMAMCKFNALNPFIREAWLVKYGPVAQMVTSKDVFIKRAYETGECEDWQAGIIVWDPEGKKYFDTKGIVPPGHEVIGGWCEVKMKDRPWMRLEVNLNEYVQHTKDGRVTQIWSPGQSGGKQATMIRKVALAQGLRESMPSRFKKVYIPDELGLDPDKMPDDAVDIKAIQNETGGERVPTNGGAQATPAEEAPAGNHPRRSRRNKFTGLDKELFPQGKIETCGVKPEQLKALRLLLTESKNRARTKTYMSETVGYQELSYLHEDEAEGLIRVLIPVSTPPESQEETFDPPESAFTEQTMAPVEDPIPMGNAETEREGRESVLCPQTGEPTYKSFCTNDCRTRKADGFCMVLGEKPPASGMFSGGAA